MALLPSELTRLKYEMGWSTLTMGAGPYVGIVAIFDQVVASYMQAGASTVSSTAVVAGLAPAPTTLTLVSAVGFSLYDRVIVDVDARQEAGIVTAVSGNTITLMLSGSHTGTFPVTVEGGESIVRDLLQQLYALGAGGGRLDKAAGTAGVKKADEVEFFGGGGGDANRLKTLSDHREYLRDELWRALFGQGREAVLSQNSAGGCSIVEVY